MPQIITKALSQSPNRHRTASDMGVFFQKFKQSGQSIKDFCNEQGVAVSVFGYWRKKFTTPAQPQVNKRSLGASNVGKRTPKRFVRLDLSGARQPVSGAMFELSFPDGHILRIPDGFKPESVKALLSLFS